MVVKDHDASAGLTLLQGPAACLKLPLMNCVQGSLSAFPVDESDQ